MSRVLVLGYGIMGQFLVEELVKKGCLVDVVCLESAESGSRAVTFWKENAKSRPFLEKILKDGRFDAVVDFMLYSIAEFREIHTLFLENTKQYIFLSSYRVYSDLELPISETSPQMVDISTDRTYLSHDDEYSLYKAREERILRGSGFRNYTIVRPSIVYSHLRFQLTSLEAPVFMTRSWHKKKVALPTEALDAVTTMTWGGDVGKMLAGLVGNKQALGEAYTLATAEHHTWREVAEIYRELFGLEYVETDTETFLKEFFDNSFLARYTLVYDRCATRIMDNRKILEAVGMKQEELMPLKRGLALEYGKLPKDKQWPHSPVNDKMDAWLNRLGIL